MNLAQIAYEAYANHTEWKSLATGQPLPQWAALSEAIQQAWSSSSAAVALRHEPQKAPDTLGCRGSTIKARWGWYVDLANPHPRMIGIDDIAAALSKICRFGGHCPKFYSVAEHCVHAVALARDDGVKGKALLAVLLHDATEAYLGDVVKPLKILLPDYCKIEARMEAVIGEAFRVDFSEHHDLIKRYDLAMLKLEKHALWPLDTEEWVGFESIPLRRKHLHFWRPAQAEADFLSMWRQLSLGDFVHESKCSECGGDGYSREPSYGDEPCVMCRGLGRIL